MFFGKKNKNKLDDDDDLLDEDDEFDFDDLGDFDEFDGNPREPSKKELAFTAGKEAARTTAKNLRQESIKEVIPGDFESNFLDVKDFASHTKDLLTDSVKEITDSVGKVLPKSLAEKLGIGGDNERQRQVSEAEAREAGIQNSINAIFNKQKNIEEKIERDKDVQREVAVESSKLAVSRLQTDVMGGMSNDISKLSGFFLDIGNEYFKKSLELQFKSYYLQMDLVKLSGTYFKAFTEQFDKIVKNTALPEHVKITQAERIEGKMKDAIAEKVYATAWSNNQYIQNIKDNIGRRIKGVTSDIKSAISGFGQIFEMGDEIGGTSSIIARMLGTMLGEKLSTKIMDKFRPHLKEKLGDNETLKRIGYTAENITKNTGGIMARLRAHARARMEENEDATEFGGKVSNKFWGLINSGLDLTRMRRRDKSIADTTMNDINEPAIFDNNVYFTINNAIPQFLGRILQQNAWLTEMYRAAHSGNKLVMAVGKPELLHFNYLKRKLDTIEGYRLSVSNFLTRRDQNQSFKTAGRRTMDMISHEITTEKGEGWKKRSKFFTNSKNLDALDDYMEALAGKKGIEGDFDKLFTKALDDDADISIKEYIRDNPHIAKIIKEINEYTAGDNNIKRRDKAVNYLETAKEDVNNNYPLGTIKETFKDIGELAGINEAKNNLTDVEATIVARAIALYQDRHPDNYLVASEKMLRSVFSEDYLQGEKSEDTVIKIGIFVRDVASIINGGSKDKIEQCHFMLGLMDMAIRSRNSLGKEGEDFFVEQIRKINSVNPELYGDIKELSVYHLHEGFVGTQSQLTEKMSPSKNGFTTEDIEEIFDSVKIESQADKIANSAILKRIGKASEGFKEAFSSGKGIKGKMANVFEYTKNEFGKDVETIRQKFYDKSKSILTGLVNITADMSKDMIKSGIEGLYKKTSETKKEVIEQKEVDIKTFEEGINAIKDSIRAIVAETNFDENEVEKLQKEVKKMEEDQVKKIAAYDQLIKSIEETENKLIALYDKEITFDREYIKELPGKIKEILGDNLSRLKAIMQITKEEEKKSE